MSIYFIILISLGCVFISYMASEKSKKLVAALSVLATAAELIVAAKILFSVAKFGSYDLPPFFFVDALGAFVLALTAFTGFVAAGYSAGHMAVENSRGVVDFSQLRKYYILFHLFLSAMFIAVVSASPVATWIFIEATTLATAFLISFYRSASSIEAAWKYLVINSVGLLLAFFGTALFMALASQAGGEESLTWSNIAANAKSLDPSIVKIAFIFVFIGFGTKIGLVPMHTWKPDAYSRTPTPIAAIFSGALMNVAFLAVLRFKGITDVAAGHLFTEKLFIVFGVVSVIIAAFLMYAQNSYKRLLAYSSIEHAGLMSVAFGIGGAGSLIGLLHMAYHAIAKSLLFFSSGNLFLKYGSTKIENVRGALKIMPLTSVLFLIGLFAIVGMPPFGLFITEFSLLSLLISQHPVGSALILLSLAVIFISFLRHGSAMIFGEAAAEIKKGEYNIWTTLPIIICVIVLFVFSIFVPQSLNLLLSGAIK